MDNLRELIEGNDYQKFKRALPGDTPKLTEIFKRWSVFESASPLIQNILLRMYPDKLTFVTTHPSTVHPIETYVLALDECMEDGQVVRALGSAIGIYIPLGLFEEAYEYYINDIVEHIDFLNSGVERNAGVDIQSFSFPTPLPTSAQMMFWRRPEFFELLRRLDKMPKDPLEAEIKYQDRLRVLREIYGWGRGGL